MRISHPSLSLIGFRINGIKNAEASDEPSGKRDDMDLKKLDEITHNQIRSRLQNLELELSTVLHSVRSNNADEIMLQKVKAHFFFLI